MKMKKIFSGFAFLLAGAALIGSAFGASEKTETKATTFTPTTTEVTGLAVADLGNGRQRLQANLSVADWGETAIQIDANDVAGAGPRVAEYNYHTNVLVNGVAITEWSGWNQRCIFVAGGAKIPKLYFDIGHANFVADDVVTFNAGTEFPSYEYVVNGSGTNSYVLADAISYKYNGSAFVKVEEFAKTYTQVASVKFTTGSAANHYCFMSIRLNDYDYSGGATEDSSWTEMTSFNLTKIKLNGADIVFDSARKNRYRAEKTGVVLYVYSADGTGSEYTNVVIPANTEFPSKAYHDSGTKTVYVVNNETTLYPTSAGFVEGTSADLAVINRVGSTRLRLGVSLTNFDHAAYTGDSSTDAYPTTYTVFASILIDGNAMARWSGMPDYRAYMFKGVAGWGFDFTFTADSIPNTIVVQAGTLYASSSYVNGGVEKYYVLTENVTFKHDGSEYSTYGCVNTLDKFANEKLKMNSIGTSETGTGLCVSEGWYTAAKAAYNALNSKDQSLFNADSSYANARARLCAWALANGETFTGGSFVTNSANALIVAAGKNKTVLTTIVIVSVVSLTSLGLLCFLKKKRAMN